MMTMMAVSNYYTSSSSSCHQLAANLTANYYSPALYNDNNNGSCSSSLEEYLSTTGVLLTMCEKWEPHCILPVVMDDPTRATTTTTTTSTFSGSWIQNSTTGVRVFGDNGVGVVLNPHVFADQIQCLYPLNAETLARARLDEYGNRHIDRCGPLMDDPIYGKIPLSWRGRLAMKLKLHWIKWTKFPLRTPWNEIPCSAILHELRDMDNNVVDDDDSNDFIDVYEHIPMMIDHDFTWKGIGYFFKETVDILLGEEEGCYDDFEPNFDDGQLLSYSGPEPWQVDSWDENAAVTKTVVEQYSPNFQRGIWNEIVIENPLAMNDGGDDEDGDHHNARKKLISEMILAVFYLNEPNREEAYILAKGLGEDIPVLELLKGDSPDDGEGRNAKEEQPPPPQIFRCPNPVRQPDENMVVTKN